MKPYDVRFTDIALKNLRRYPPKDQRLILERIEELAQNPKTKSNVKQLVHFDVSFRLRVGSYRVLFDLDNINRVIDVIDILPRRQAYRRR